MKGKKLSLSIQILIGLVAGIIAGVLLNGHPDIATNYIKPFGSLFLNLIKLVIVPLVFGSLIQGIASLGDIKKVGRIGGKTFIYFLTTTAFAIVIGLVFANVLNVAGGYVLPEAAAQASVEVKEAPRFIDTLVNIIPSNPLKAIVDGHMLQLIAFALIFGAGILAIGEKGKVLFSVFDSLAETMYKITGAIMKLAPIGVFALMTPVVAQQGIEILKPLARVILVCYAASLVHVLLVYTLAVKGLSGMSPAKFLKGAFPAWMLAFTTASSAASLPLAMECAEDNLGVSKPVTSFVLPLGNTINMDGTAIYQGVCVLFIAQVFGVDLTVTQQLTIVLTTVLASIGTAGVPGAGLIMLTMVLQSVGLPIEGIALVAGIDRILDMARTSLNVLGDISATVIIEHSEQKRLGQGK